MALTVSTKAISDSTVGAACICVFWLGVRVVAVAAIIDQGVANAIAPQLIGGIVGLNPVWILVSLLLGTKIAGVLGLIVAVPVASSIKGLFEEFKTPPASPTAFQPDTAIDPVEKESAPLASV